MSNAWSLNIRVLSASAQPVQTAAVTITASPVPVPDIAALTGPDGWASIGVPCAGDYGVMVNAEGYAIVVQQIAAVEDDSRTDVMLNK